MSRNAFLLLAIVGLGGCTNDPPASGQANGAERAVPPAEVPADDGWASKDQTSPVQGTQHLAQFLMGAGTEADPVRVIEIVCVDRTKQVSVKLVVESAPMVAEFIQYSGSTQDVYAKGSMVSALNKTPVNASKFFQMVEFKNSVSLNPMDFNNTNTAGNLLTHLPLAVELESNVGTILFEIPRSDLVLGAIEPCVPDPGLKVARDAAQANVELEGEAAKVLEKKLQAEVDAMRLAADAAQSAEREVRIHYFQNQVGQAELDAAEEASAAAVAEYRAGIASMEEQVKAANAKASAAFQAYQELRVQ